MNLNLYNAVRSVPQEAQKPIAAGRLKGKTDINPMWRIKALTEQFGPCGIGWKYTIDRQWIEQGASGEIAAFCNISLYIKHEGEWSDAIPGTGGSAFVASERSGLYTSDECYKMALTDAISVSCKALGFGADVYWNADASKYGAVSETYGTTPEYEKERADLLLAIEQSGHTIDKINASCRKKYGKMLRQLNNDQLTDVCALLSSAS